MKPNLAQHPSRRTFISGLLLAITATASRSEEIIRRARLLAPEDKLNAGWVRRACLAFEVLNTDPKNATAEQKQMGNDSAFLFGGFIAGLNSAMIVITPTDEDRKMLAIPDRMLDFDFMIPSLGEFLKAKKKDIPDSAPFARAITAWYLTTHPNSTLKEKTMAEVLVEELREKERVD